MRVSPDEVVKQQPNYAEWQLKWRDCARMRIKLVFCLSDTFHDFHINESLRNMSEPLNEYNSQSGVRQSPVAVDTDSLFHLPSIFT